MMPRECAAVHEVVCGKRDRIGQVIVDSCSTVTVTGGCMGFTTSKFLFVITTALLMLTCGAPHCSSIPVSSKSSVRTLKFPGKTSIGTLSVLFVDRWMIGGETPIHAAAGTVTVTVPPLHILQFEANLEAFVHPDLLEAAPVEGIDSVKLGFMAMDDSENTLCDAAVARVGHFKGAYALFLDRSDVTDAAVARIAPMPRVEHFSASLTNIKGSCLRNFGQQFPKLKVLLLDDNQLESNNVQYLAACRDLYYVDMHHSNANNALVKALSKCANLSTMRVGINSLIDDKCIADILTMKKLKTLELDATGVSFAGVRKLKALHLDNLSVSQELCSAKDLPELRSIAKNVQLVRQGRKVNRDMKYMLAPLH